jgi:hypothetical protein
MLSNIASEPIMSLKRLFPLLLLSKAMKFPYASFLSTPYYYVEKISRSSCNEKVAPVIFHLTGFFIICSLFVRSIALI